MAAGERNSLRPLWQPHLNLGPVYNYLGWSTYMDRRKPQLRQVKEPEEILSLAQQAVNYVRPYLKWLMTGAVALAVLLVAWSGYAYLQHSRESRAQAALEQTRPKLSQPEQAEEALKGLTALIQEYPSTQAAQMARVFKAHLLYQTGKYAEAAKNYEELRSSLGNPDPYGWGPFVSESLSYCYEAQGEYVKAAQTLKPLVDQAKGDYQSIMLEHLALLYDKAGNRQEAAEA
uniref:Tetratricopeptide repeat protein n=1 Tax=Desulfobacca acetoxidans TaxID=60893 RepID=A0A7C3V558_9BACT